MYINSVDEVHGSLLMLIVLSVFCNKTGMKEGKTYLDQVKSVIVFAYRIFFSLQN